MRKFAASAIFCSGALLLVLSGCETETCRSACNIIYEECGLTPMMDCDTAEISSVDCGDPAAWVAHQKNECITDCERAMYTPATDEEVEETDKWYLADEEDASRFIDCVVEHDMTNCKTDFWVDCQWIRW